MFEVVNYIFFSSLSLSPLLLFLSRTISCRTRISIVRHAFFSLSLSLSLSLVLLVYCLAIFLSHRLLHHQRPGALQYIYYIGYVVVIVVRDVKGVDGEEREREREIESVVHYLNVCMYL